MSTIWKGTLERGGRAPEPFAAEIVEFEGKSVITERRGVEVKAVSPHEISGDSWLKALVAQARAQAGSGS